MEDAGTFASLLALWPQGAFAGGIVALVLLAVRLAFSQRKITASADGRTEKADLRYEDEVAAHRVTQALLDEERERRRRIEDEMSDVKAEVRQLRREVAALRRQLDGTGT